MENKPLENIADAASEKNDALTADENRNSDQAEAVHENHEEGGAPNGGEEPQSDRAQPSEDSAPVRRRQAPVIDQEKIDREFVEKAGDPAEYLVYQKDEIALDAEQLHVYAASRIGLGHIRKKTVCQDACMYRRIRHGVVLLDADGISACDYGQVGAKLACETAADAVERLSGSVADEGDFVRALCATEFYAALREEWVRRVENEWAAMPHPADDSPLLHFGTTLLFAVVTANWYVTFNLGDGQILLFNDDECMRVRMAEKEGQAPYSLIYGTYLEDVQRGVWDRRLYKGILLTTDGVYDRISRLPWYAGQQYALQTAERFEKYSEPRAPFIYTGDIAGEQRTIDLSRQRGATDDCSIVMALNETYVPVGRDAVGEIRNHFRDVSAVQLLRRCGTRASYLVYGPDGYRVIFAVPAQSLPLRDPRLKHFTHGSVQLWKCEERWKTEGICYSAYRLAEKENCNFLEGSFQCSLFHSADQYHKVPDEYDQSTGKPLRIVEPLVAESVVRAYRTLEALEEHLACQNMRLNEMATAWIVQVQNKQGDLLIPIEALCETDAPAAETPWTLSIQALFPGLIGYLSCRGADMPLFAPGEGTTASNYYLFGAPKRDEALNRFFRIRYNAGRKQYGLYNLSRFTWNFVNAEGRQIAIAPGKTVGLSSGCKITVPMDDGKEFVCECRMI